MRVIAVANQKGGVGKTTTAVTLAGLAVDAGSPALLVDLDPHGSLSAYFGRDPDQAGPSVYSLFQARFRKEAVDPATLLAETRIEGLWVLPASTAQATLDRQLGTQEGMGLVLGDALRALRGRFDTVLLDCPPMLGVLMINALAACDRLLIPVQTEFLALKGLERMLHTLDMINRARRLQVPYTIIPTFFDRRTRASNDCLELLGRQYAGRLSGAVIPVDTRIRDASRAGLPLSRVHDSHGPSRALEAYRAVYGELFGVLPTTGTNG